MSSVQSCHFLIIDRNQFDLHFLHDSGSVVRSQRLQVLAKFLFYFGTFLALGHCFDHSFVADYVTVRFYCYVALSHYCYFQYYCYWHYNIVSLVILLLALLPLLYCYCSGSGHLCCQNHSVHLNNGGIPGFGFGSSNLSIIQNIRVSK